MHIEINDNTTIREIQDTFSDYYPWLQIQFYNKQHKKYESSSEASRVDPDKTIGEIRKTHLSSLLEIQPMYKVAEIEREFRERFGLSVQVLGKEKDDWIQTMGMDDFTIRDLNEIARNSSDEFILSDLEEEEQEEAEENI